jgi:hypothetical protein
MAEKRQDCHRCQKEVPLTYVVNALYQPTRFYCSWCWIQEMGVGEFTLYLNAVANEAIHRLEDTVPLPDLPPDVWQAAADVPDLEED